MNETYVTVVGNVVADPQLRTSKSGQPFATLRLASTERRRASEGYVDGDTNYFNIIAFGRLGLNAAHSLTKGQRVMAYGRMRTRHWEDKTGVPRQTSDLEVYALGPDLTWGWTTYVKGTAPNPHDRLNDPEVRAAVTDEVRDVSSFEVVGDSGDRPGGDGTMQAPAGEETWPLRAAG